MEIKFSGADRRKFKRVKVNLSVFYRKDEPLEVRIRSGDKEGQASMIDLSEGGVAILTDMNIPVSTPLNIKFTLCRPERDQGISFFGRIELLGEVRNSIMVNNNSYRLGIVFVVLDAVSRHEILNFMNVLEKGEK